MSKSKKDLIAEYVEIGGAREDFPDNLDDTTVAAIEDKIEALKLQQQLQGAENEQAKNQQPGGESQETNTAPAATEENTKVPPAEGKTEAGILFTLTKAASFGSGALPGKNYESGKPFRTEDEEEIAVLRRSGLFKEGE